MAIIRKYARTLELDTSVDAEYLVYQFWKDSPGVSIEHWSHVSDGPIITKVTITYYGSLADWRDEFPLGTRVAIVGKHPAVGRIGTVTHHFDAGSFYNLDKKGLIVTRDDSPLEGACIIDPFNLAKIQLGE